MRDPTKRRKPAFSLPALTLASTVSPMSDDTNRAAPEHAAAVATIGAAWLLLAATAETLFVDAPSAMLPVGPVATTAIWVGFVPFLFAARAGQRLATLPRVVRRLAFWAPLFAGLAVGTFEGLRGGLVDGAAVGMALLACTAFAALAPRLLPTLRETPDGFFAPTGVLAVIVGFVCANGTRDVFDVASPIAMGVPIVVGAAAVVAQVFHQALQRRTARVVAAMTAVISVLGAATVIALAAWLPELNASLKLLVAWCLAFATAVFAEPVLRRRRWSRAGAFMGLALAAATAMYTLAAPIPTRFAGVDPRAVAASGVALLSMPADRDSDGFYAAHRGGNDCDDGDPARHPFAASGARNCLPEVPPPRPNDVPIAPTEHVLLVIVDALRADVVSDPSAREAFPAMDQLAGESVRFSVGYAPGNSTFTSLPTLLSGLGPQVVLGAIAHGDPAPYAELMRGRWVFDASERCTALLVSAHEETSWLFELYPRDVDIRVTETRVDENNHGSWTIPPALVAALEQCGERPTLIAIYMDDPHLEGIAGHSCFGGTVGGEACYRDEITAVDRALADVFAAYRARGIWDKTAVIFTSDHGEALGERGHDGHTSNVFEEQVRVPIWLRRPGIAGADVDVPASGLSVAPTVRALIGQPIAPEVYPTLAAVASGQGAPPPVSTSSTGRVKRGWTSPVTSLRRGDHKLVHQWMTNRSALFDLAADPGERDDLAAAHGPLVAELEAELFAIERALLTRAYDHGQSSSDGSAE